MQVRLMTLGFLLMTVWIMTFSKSSSTLSKYGSTSSIITKVRSIIPPSEEPEHEKFDMVEFFRKRVKMAIYRAVGTVKRVDPARPHYVRLYGQQRVIVIAGFTKFYVNGR